MKTDKQPAAPKSWMPEQVKKHGFTMVPNLLFVLAERDSLDGIERALLVALLSNVRTASPIASASFADLARTSGWSRSVVVKAMKRLEQRTLTGTGDPAFIVLKSGRARGGTPAKNTYSLDPFVKRISWLARERTGESTFPAPSSAKQPRGRRKRKKPEVEGFGTPDHGTLSRIPDLPDDADDGES